MTNQQTSQLLLWLCGKTADRPSERALEAAGDPSTAYDASAEIRFVLDSALLRDIERIFSSEDAEASLLKEWASRSGYVDVLNKRFQDFVFDDISTQCLGLFEHILAYPGLKRGNVIEMDPVIKTCCWILANYSQSVHDGPRAVAHILSTHSTVVAGIRSMEGIPSPTPREQVLTLIHPASLAEHIHKEEQKIVTLQ